MNDAHQSFEAFLFHPDWGGEPLGGRIYIGRDSLRYEAGELCGEIPLARLGVRYDEPGGRTFFNDPEQPDLKIFTPDEAVLNCPALRRSGRMRHLEQSALRREVWRRWRLTLAFLAGFALVAWLCSLLAGLMVRSLVAEIPASWEMEFGDSMMAQLQKKLPLVDDSNAVAQLTALARPLTRSVPAGGVKFRFHIMENSFPNAFALPGGHIVVTTGLLDMTAGHPGQLLGVLAHEMAHVTRKHAFRQLISSQGPVFILQLFMGSRSRMLRVLAYPSEKLIYESFSQAYEKEADAVGWDYLVRAHINPHGMIEAFEGFEKLEARRHLARKPSAYDSHPSLVRRIEWLQEKWKALPEKGGFMELTNPVPEVKESDSAPIFWRR